jgi:hypothetical protein
VTRPVERFLTAGSVSEEPAGGTGGRSTFGTGTGGSDWRLVALRSYIMIYN